MADLADRIKPLLSVAPSDVYVVRRPNASEVFILRGKVVWLSVTELRSVKEHEFIIEEWDDDKAKYSDRGHYFDCEWSFKSWLCEQFLGMKVKNGLAV